MLVPLCVYHIAADTNDKSNPVYGKCSNYVKQRDTGWKELESRHQSIRESVYVHVCALEGVVKYTSVCVIWCEGRKNVRELPRVERRGLDRDRLQSDVLLTINSVQPDKITKRIKPCMLQLNTPKNSEFLSSFSKQC